MTSDSPAGLSVYLESQLFWILWIVDCDRGRRYNVIGLSQQQPQCPPAFIKYKQNSNPIWHVQQDCVTCIMSEYSVVCCLPVCKVPQSIDVPGLLQVLLVSLLVLGHMPAVRADHQPLYPTVAPHRLLLHLHLEEAWAVCWCCHGPVTTELTQQLLPGTCRSVSHRRWRISFTSLGFSTFFPSYLFAFTWGGELPLTSSRRWYKLCTWNEASRSSLWSRTLHHSTVFVSSVKHRSWKTCNLYWIKLSSLFFPFSLFCSFFFPNF